MQPRHTPPTLASSTESGFALIEILIVVVLAPILLGVGIRSLMSSQSVTTTVNESTFATERLRTCLRRLGDELMASGRLAEDENDNDTLDAGEDTNANSRLDSDWSVSGDSITFNKMLFDGTYSLPITFSLVDNTLVRSELLPSGDTQAVTIARSVNSFSVLATGEREVTISLAVSSGSTTRSSTIQVTQRN